MRHFLKKTCSLVMLTFNLTVQITQGSGIQEENRISSSESTQNIDPFAYASSPDGKVLPESIARIRIVQKKVTGNRSYDRNGEKQDIGADFQGQGAALVFEYGFTKKLSFRTVAPFFTENSLRLDKNKFFHSKLFKHLQTERRLKLAQELANGKKLCADFESCLEYIERDRSLPMDRSFKLNNNEYAVLRANKSIKQQIDENILRAATPASKGSVGLGDVESGLLYNWLGTDFVSISTGVGLRIPTGDYNVPDGKRPTGFGANDIGFQGNFDISPFAGMWLQARGKFEKALTSAKKEPTSLLDSSKFASEGNPTPDKTLVRYNKAGWDKQYMLRANYGLGALTPNLKAIGVSTGYFNSYTRAITINNLEQTPESQVQYAGLGATISGLGYKIPLEFDFSYLEPVAGKNISMARAEIETQLKFFAKF